MNNEQMQMTEVSHDVVQLPSKGLYYLSKKERVKISYLTAADENILTSMNLLESGEMFDVLLDRKILDKDLRPSEMLDGDRVALLFWLRATGYGAIFPLKLTDPATRQSFEYDIDLTTIQYKENLLDPNEAGECEFVLPISKKIVKFKFLSSGELTKIIKEDADRQAKLGKRAFSNLLTNKLAAQIKEVDEIRDRGQIAQFVNQLAVGDSSALRKYINEHEPGLDLDIEVTAPSGIRFPAKVNITAEFFWAYL
jgi:hypothetical protein